MSDRWPPAMVRRRRAVGQRLAIDEVHGEVKPADKLALVEAPAGHEGVSWRWPAEHQRRPALCQGGRRHHLMGTGTNIGA